MSDSLSAPEAVVDALVPPVDLTDVVDDALSIGGEGGQQHGHAGPNIGTLHHPPGELRWTGDHDPMGVAQEEPRTEADELVYEEQA
jgi:hypothetical protein